MARKGQSAQFLKKLRKKFKLGEFKPTNTSSRRRGGKRRTTTTTKASTRKRTYFVKTTPDLFW